MYCQSKPSSHSSSFSSSFPSLCSPFPPDSQDLLPFPLKDTSPFPSMYPSSFKSFRLPFKGTEISFGNIKPPLNRLLIPVGFSNFFLRLSYLSATVQSEQSCHFYMCVLHAGMLREGEKDLPSCHCDLI